MYFLPRNNQTNVTDILEGLSCTWEVGNGARFYNEIREKMPIYCRNLDTFSATPKNIRAQKF